jgi:acetyl esterase
VRAEVPTEAVEESRQFNRRLEEALAALPPPHRVPAAQTRRAYAQGGGIFGPVPRSERAVTRVVPGPDGGVPVRIVRPEGGPRAVLLHIHGGGWTLGGADQQDPLLEALADRCGVAAVSVEYRLAPEHPYPAAPDDCEAAALWLLREGRAEFGTDRLLIGGESAGAHLAVVTLLRLRDRHGARNRFAAANLVFGCYDLSLTPSARNWGARYLLLSTPIIEWFAANFLPHHDLEARRQPDISPLYADLGDMPPALFTVGDLDPIVDDTLFLAARWRQAGNPCHLRVYPEAPHGFTAFPTTIGHLGNKEQLRFVAAMASG